MTLFCRHGWVAVGKKGESQLASTSNFFGSSLTNANVVGSIFWYDTIG